MKFYVIEDSTEQRVGCELTKAAAHKVAAEMGITDYSLRTMDVQVNAETVRRLLGNIGGFA